VTSQQAFAAAMAELKELEEIGRAAGFRPPDLDESLADYERALARHGIFATKTAKQA
jgi:hypothetical protein